MSFADAQAEVRGRFVEALQVINSIDPGEGRPLTPSTDPEKALRGLALVAIYAAVERAVNAYVEEALALLTSHAEKVDNCTPEVQALHHFPRIQSLRDCASEKSVAASIELFLQHSLNPRVVVPMNPLSLRLQNVDGETIEYCCQYLGISGYRIEPSPRGRLNNLRERRNAVSHGRESAVQVGGRFTYAELRLLLSIADAEIERFGATLRGYFEARAYLRRSA